MKTKSLFRMVYYDQDGKRHTVYPESRAQDSDAAMTALLEQYVESGATGGHIETYVGDSIGWVIAE